MWSSKRPVGILGFLQPILSSRVRRKQLVHFLRNLLRSWDEGRSYGFISAGGGTWYSNTLNLLNIGDRVWVKAPGYGFVGVGEVTGPREPITAFRIETADGERPAFEALTGGSYHREFVDDPERMEYFLPVSWVHSVPLEEAVNEIGMFGNQNTVCKPTTPKWRTTVDRLKERWGLSRNGIEVTEEE